MPCLVELYSFTHLEQTSDVIPKSARSLHEEAWNAYPYARTKFSCEFVPRFVLDIESRYVADCGTQVILIVFNYYLVFKTRDGYK